MPDTKDAPYIASLREYADAMKAALEVADDPFKAPELTVATGQRVINAVWSMQMEYAILTRKDTA